MVKMRAKLKIGFVQEHRNGPDGEKTGETLNFHAVAAKSYPEDGSDEDNTYAKFSPAANVSIHVANPALFGRFEVGQAYYVDFTPAE